ncbi:hypothetical protein IC620_06770 [Hazenella sp. IB182357]|uniref:Uncharacterized protein n=1 Tax=Polycladospora coralii TaxID=2771432 RepID=A0A926RX05_9BACL|nr:hypothetical protein [Polycladospora coralii]MBD1372061.1 hypothetical protein [Polycladospora coralii]MBS7530567.1 hypothetical protein [Polycladospora coralii]
MTKKSLLGCMVSVMVLSYSAMAHADNANVLKLEVGQYYDQSKPFQADKGTLEITIENEGPDVAYYYVFEYCDYLECPVVTWGDVEQGEKKLDSFQVLSGKYIFKIESPEGNTNARAFVRQQ